MILSFPAVTKSESQQRQWPRCLDIQPKQIRKYNIPSILKPPDTLIVTFSSPSVSSSIPGMLISLPSTSKDIGGSASLIPTGIVSEKFLAPPSEKSSESSLATPNFVSFFLMLSIIVWPRGHLLLSVSLQPGPPIVPFGPRMSDHLRAGDGQGEWREERVVTMAPSHKLECQKCA